jgi:hypothetical protein
MASDDVRFSVAGLEVLLRAASRGSLRALSGFYQHYPAAGGAVHLVVEVEQVPGFAAGRARGPEYPAFRKQMTSAGTIALSRFDAEGELALPDGPDEPVRARFRVGDSTNSLEAAIRIGASVAMPRLGGLVMHASAVGFGGRALVFAGVSGAGKSTIAAMLDEGFPAVTKVSDELVILRPGADGTWRAHVTPFIGSEGLPHGRSLPLRGVHFLAQAPGHRRTPMAPAAALREILRHVLVYVAEPRTADTVLGAAAALVAAVPCHRLEFAKDCGVASELGIA